MHLCNLCKGHVYTPPYYCAQVTCVHLHLLNHVHYTVAGPAILQSAEQYRMPNQPWSYESLSLATQLGCDLLLNSDFQVVLPPSAPSLQPGL